MEDKLTIKQEEFVQGLFAGLSQRQAYKKAFDTSNMADKTIDEKACLLAKKGKVRARISELTNELKERNMVTVERVLEELSNIAFDDIKNYISFYTDEKGQTQIEVKNSDTIDTRNISEVSLSKKDGFKFKLYGKDSALIQIGKHLGMFVDRKEFTGKDGGPIQMEAMTTEQREQRIKELLDRRSE
ncbi:terminase small subunit [Desulfosporosinus sp. FKA]|uniref:terminase small subunit n=1 Tax=Desulfosporosinus sp. FKA TaxID=1969834 RepID=UPI000B49E79E|nr:terminase small subunit [Desulfosporosinus sp. FKA]